MRRALVLVLAAATFSSGVSRLAAQITSGFVSITPCRLMDTRLASGAGYPAPYGTPSFAANEKRVIVTTGAIASNNPCANLIPTFATGIAANFTVTLIGGSGDLRIAPGDLTGNATPLSNSILNFNPPTSAIANATSADIDGSGRLTIESAVHGAAVIVDIFGYYTREGTSNGAIVAGKNDGTGNGVLGTTQATDNSGAGVSGHGDNGAYGVYGQSSTNAGVRGLSTDGNGVSGSSSNGDGVHGLGANGVSGMAFGSGSGVVGTGGGSGPGVLGTATGNGPGVKADGGGGVALEIANGVLRATGSPATVFWHNTGTAGTCKLSGGYKVSIINNAAVNGNGGLFLFPVVVSWNSGVAGESIGVDYTGSNGNGGCPANRWVIYDGGYNDIDPAYPLGINILVISQ